MVRHYPNLIVGRTFSKIYGLAAMRLGWAAIHKELLPHYRKVQTPFNTNLLALLAGKAALNDAKFLEESLRVNREGLDHLRRAFSRLNVRSFPTAGNFLAFEAPGGMSAKEFCDKLLTHGIILRDASRFRGAPDNLVRVTVGTQIENNKVLAALEEILQD
jgi:histidinol-phosphate aminotransferase